MVSRAVQTTLAGVTCVIRVSYARTWYVVELPCEMQIKVNPKALYKGLPLNFNPQLVAFKAVEHAENLKPSSKLGKMLRSWASSQCIEGKAWVAKNG